MKQVMIERGAGYGLMLAALLTFAACDQSVLPAIGGASGSVAPAGSVREYLVLGSTMNFEECRARGGIIIRDQGSPMVACDPRVRRAPVPADEFDHPGSPVPQLADAIEG